MARMSKRKGGGGGATEQLPPVFREHLHALLFEIVEEKHDLSNTRQQIEYLFIAHGQELNNLDDILSRVVGDIVGRLATITSGSRQKGREGSASKRVPRGFPERLRSFLDEIVAGNQDHSYKGVARTLRAARPKIEKFFIANGQDLEVMEVELDNALSRMVREIGRWMGT